MHEPTNIPHGADVQASFPNLRHLFAIYEVAQTKSVSIAAERVHISQPALTQAIAGIEEQVGAKLFKRTNAGMFLTSVGQIYIVRTGRALSHIRDGANEIMQSRAAAGARRGVNLEKLMTSAQLRALVAVVDNGNFAMAARASGLSQPSIHRSARDLERIVGVSLFEKTSYGVQPTREARKLSLSAKRAFSEMRQARSEISALSGFHTGTTVVGTMPLARTYLAPKAIIDFASEYPDQNIELTEGPYEHLIEGLRSGDIDLLIGAMRPSLPVSDVEQQLLFKDMLSVVVRKGHPLTSMTSVSMPDVMKFPWLAPHRGTPLRANFEQLFRDAKEPFQKRLIECNSLMAARVMLAESNYVMLLSSHQIRYEKKMGLLVELQEPDLKLSRDIGVTVRCDWVPTQAQKRFLAILQEHAKAL